MLTGFGLVVVIGSVIGLVTQAVQPIMAAASAPVYRSPTQFVATLDSGEWAVFQRTGTAALIVTIARRPTADPPTGASGARYAAPNLPWTYGGSGAPAPRIGPQAQAPAPAYPPTPYAAPPHQSPAYPPPEAGHQAKVDELP